jgi:hypothetical protein
MLPLIWLALTFTATATELELEVVGVGYDLTQATRSRIRRSLSRMIAYYSNQLGVPIPDTIVLNVTIHRDRAAYLADGGSPNTLGHYTYRPPRAVLWANTSTDKMMAVFLHESAHFLIGTTQRRAPTWANEGLAEGFEAARMEGNGMYLQPPPMYLRYLKWERDQGKRFDVAGIIGDRGGWMELPPEQMGPRYAWSWTLTHFLLSSTRGRKLLADVLTDFRAHGDPQRSLDLMERSWPRGVFGLTEDLEAWIQEGPAPVQIPLPLSTRDDDQAFVRCEDGRLVARDNPNGCKAWRIGADGTLVLE